MATLDQYFFLLSPGLRQIIGKHTSDPFHPCLQLDMWREPEASRLGVRADWKDGSKHFAYLPLAELEAEPILAFNKAVREVCPAHVFDDEIVVAYDDSGWR